MDSSSQTEALFLPWCLTVSEVSGCGLLRKPKNSKGERVSSWSKSPFAVTGDDGLIHSLAGSVPEQAVTRQEGVSPCRGKEQTPGTVACIFSLSAGLGDG